jgi:hypothetical protein
MTDPNKKTADNGKGSSPRNNFSRSYRSNYEAINWKKKQTKPNQNEYKAKKS